MGDWENLTFDYLEDKFSDSYGLCFKNFGRASCVNGESVLDLQNRFESEIRKIAEGNKGKTIFVFTHSGAIRTFVAKCYNKPIDEMKDVPWSTNASITITEYNNGEFKVIEYSKYSHLGEAITSLPKNV